MELVPTQDEVLALLRQTGALQNGHFECLNGLHTDINLETALAMRYHRNAKTLSVGLSRKLRANAELRALIPELSIVAATPAGLPVAYGLCEALRAGQVYWAEKDGRDVPMRFRQFLEPVAGEKVVLVDDLLRSGMLLTEARRLLEARGAQVWPGRPGLSADAANARLRILTALLPGQTGRHLLRRCRHM
jgi:orotate phosphoribosyltransferase